VHGTGSGRQITAASNICKRLLVEGIATRGRWLHISRFVNKPQGDERSWLSSFHGLGYFIITPQQGGTKEPPTAAGIDPDFQHGTCVRVGGWRVRLLHWHLRPPFLPVVLRFNREATVQQPTNFQQNLAMRGQVIDDLANSPSPFSRVHIYTSLFTITGSK